MPISAVGGPSSFMGGLSAPGSQGGPSLNLPGFNQSAQIDPGLLQTDPGQVYSLLAQAQPQSMTNTLGPLLQQIFGTQSNLMQPIFQQQTNQNVAQAQSSAQQRGLTGSTIEQAGMQNAQTQGQNAFDQYLGGQLSGLYGNYASALGQDVNNQTGYLNNLAQAVGQQYGNQQQYNQFLQQLGATQNMASQANTAGLEGAGISALGSMGGAGISAMFSDIRLKEDLEPIGTYKDMTVYSFKYKQDNDFNLPTGNKIGLLGHEVLKHRPECVSVENGYLKVDYKRLLDA